jgi:putative drug exporter of the RND superfamily
MAQVTVRPPSRFVRLARLCNRHRWRTFGVWLLALILIQVVAASVGVKEISTFRLPGTESQRAYDLLAEHFPAAKGDTDQIVYKARTGSLEDTANRKRIESSIRKIRAQSDVASVASPFGDGGRLTEDGRIGVATLNYKESTNDIEPDDLKDVQDAAFTARSESLQVEHGGPGAEVVRFSESQGPSEGVGVSPRRSCCCSRSDRWWRRPSR